MIQEQESKEQMPKELIESIKKQAIKEIGDTLKKQAEAVDYWKH